MHDWSVIGHRIQLWGIHEKQFRGFSTTVWEVGWNCKDRRSRGPEVVRGHEAVVLFGGHEAIACFALFCWPNNLIQTRSAHMFSSISVYSSKGRLDVSAYSPLETVRPSFNSKVLEITIPTLLQFRLLSVKYRLWHSLVRTVNFQWSPSTHDYEHPYCGVLLRFDWDVYFRCSFSMPTWKGTLWQ